MSVDRGQAYTLEALTAAVLLVTSIIFALQVTAVTPLTASTSSEHIENQQGAVAEGLLASAAEQGNLKPTILFWDGTVGEFHRSTYLGAYTEGGPPTAFGTALNETFRDRGIAFDVNVHYLNRQGQRRTEELVNFGEPSTHAIAATRVVTLYDNDPLYDGSGATNVTIQNRSISFYAPDISPGSRVFNVVIVEVVVWRM